MWWHIPVIQYSGGWGRRTCKFKASLDCLWKQQNQSPKWGYWEMVWLQLVTPTGGHCSVHLKETPDFPCSLLLPDQEQSSDALPTQKAPLIKDHGNSQHEPFLLLCLLSQAFSYDNGKATYAHFKNMSCCSHVRVNLKYVRRPTILMLDSMHIFPRSCLIIFLYYYVSFPATLWWEDLIFS